MKELAERYNTGVWDMSEIGKYNFKRNEILLLRIGYFKTNQIVEYLPGGYMMNLKTTWTSFLVPLQNFCSPLFPQAIEKKLDGVGPFDNRPSTN